MSSKRSKRFIAFVLSILMLLTSIHFTHLFADSEDEGENKPSISTTFIDEAEDPIKSLNVQVYKIEGSAVSKVQTVTTDANGKLDFEVAVGEYLLVPDLTKHTIPNNATAYMTVGGVSGFLFKSNGGGKNPTHVILNNRLGSIKFFKKEISTDPDQSIIYLSGATYELYDENKEKIASATTDSSGLINFPNLKFGKYYVKETKAPDGYAIDGTEYELLVAKEGTTSINKGFVDDYKKHNITVYKQDEETGEPLSGAKIGLYFGEELKETKITDSEGKVVFSNVDFEGKTYPSVSVREIEAPEGYLASGDCSYTWYGPNHGPISGLLEDVSPKDPFTNKRDRQKYIVKKDADTGEILPGAVLTFYYAKPATGSSYVFDTDNDPNYDYNDGNETNDVLMTELVVDEERGAAFSITTTDEPTNITDKLETGNAYIVKETKAPEGYVTNSNISSDFVWGIKNAHDTLIYNKGTITLLNKKQGRNVTVEFSKEDKDTNVLIPGAKFSIYKAKADGTLLEKVVYTENGQNVDTFTSTAGTLLFPLPEGKYVIREEEAPAGYTLAEDIKFTISSSTPDRIKQVMSEEKTKVYIKKTDEKGEMLSGALLQILDSNKNVVKEFTSKNEATLVEGLAVGKYILHESEAPEGYDKAADIEFEVTLDNKVNAVPIVMVDGVSAPLNTLNISKISSDKDGGYLSGAKIKVYQYLTEGEFEQIQYGEYTNPVGSYAVEFDIDYIEFASDYDEDDEGYLVLVDEFTTNNNENIHTITNLPNGKYWIVEEEAPVGYYLNSKPIVVELEGNTAQVVNKAIENTPVKVEVSKIDEDTTLLLPGATLQLIHDGQVIEEWVSTNAVKIFKGLVIGDTYTIREKEAPKDYQKASDMSFEVKDLSNAESKVQEVVFKNARTPFVYTINIDKTILGKDPVELVPNAKLLLEKQNDTTWTTIARWDTGDNPETKVITNQTEGFYRLTEVKTPDGFLTADPVYFTLTKDGYKLIPIVGATDENAGRTKADENENVYIEMADDYTTVFIKKIEYSEENGETPSDELAKTAPVVVGATLKVTDKDGKQVGPVKFVTTDDGKGYLFEHILGAGKTYTLTELDAPGRFELMKPMTFTVEDTSDEQTVIAWDKHRDVKYDLTVKKVDSEGNNIAGAELTLRQIDPETGDPIVENVDTWTTTQEAHDIEVRDGTYVLTEVTAPDGYKLAPSITFTLAEDQVRTATGYEDKVEKVMYDKKTVASIKKVNESSVQLEGADLAIYEITNPVFDDTGKVDLEKSSIARSAAYSFTTSGEEETITGILNTNTYYVLKETKAPNKYDIAEPVVFYMDNKDDVTNVTMVDNLTEIPTFDVVIVKTDANESPLANARLALFKVIGNEEVAVGQVWTSSARVGESFTLEPGEYIVKELSTPAGYAFTGTSDYAARFIIGNGIDTVDSANVETKTDGSKEVIVKNDKTKVAVIKVDNDNKPLAGASLAVYDGEDIVESWTSTEDKDGYIITGKLVAGKTYVLKELSAPKGFDVASPMSFTVPKFAKTLEVKMVDNKTQIKTYDISFSKVDITTKNEIDGAEVKVEKITNNGNILIDSWVSTGEVHIIKNLVPGKYVFTETTAPAGYVKAEAIEFTLKEDGSSETSKVMEDDYTKVDIEKIDENGNPVVGAKLQLVDKDGALVDSWTTSESPKHIDRLPVGHYTLKEIEAPDDFEIAQDTPFEVLPIAKLQHVSMVDYHKDVPKYDVNISKKDITTKDEIEDAKLTVTYTVAGKTITADSWLSTKEAHKISGIRENTIYTLTETSAPDGYVKAESIVFAVVTVDEEQKILVGKVGDKLEDLKELGSLKDSIVMYDDYTKVNITKVNSKNTALEGATLELRDSKGKVVETWVSTKSAKEFNRLPVGKYTLVETKAPSSDYVLADPFEFEVTETASAQNISLTNLLTTEVTTYDINISKVDITNSKEIEGAKLILRTKDGKKVEEWTSTKEAHVIKNLKYGTYTLTELSAPSGYVKAETIEFTLDKNGKSKTSIVMKDDVTKVEISKQDKENKKDLKGAKLELRDADGKLVEEWTSDGSAKVFKGLKHGKYTLKEVEAPEGFKKADDITFEVTDEPKTIKVYMYDEKDGKDKKDDDKKATTEKESNNKKEKVQTGDDNNIAPFVLGGLGLIVIIVISVVTLVKKKKEDKEDK